MARKFIYIVAALIVLVIAGGFVIRIYEAELTELAFVPTAKFEKQAAFEPTKYAGNDMWFARPGKAANPADWLPVGAANQKFADQRRYFSFIRHPISAGTIGMPRWTMQNRRIARDCSYAAWRRPLPARVKCGRPAIVRQL